MNEILYTPSQETMEQSQMMQFMHHVNKKYGTHISDYATLHHWSTRQLENFWESAWEFFGIIASQKAKTILENPKDMEKSKWFLEAQLNFAENLLQRRDDHTAIIFHSENNDQQKLTYAELFHQVAVWAKQLREYGVKPGDRVAGFMPNTPETIIAMLATTSIGAVWSSCSPNFGLQGLLNRFAQITPKILFAVESHQYNGKKHDHLKKIAALLDQLPSVEKTIIVPYLQKHPDITQLNNAILWTDIQSDKTPELLFEQRPFDHPTYILYSSGTTGKPKCMVHGAGGTLLQHLKELRLHTDLREDDKIFFYTTCGWMMWNWLVSSLAVGATIVLYDGSPVFPKSKRLLDLIDQIGITVFGVGAKLIESMEKTKLVPIKTHSLKTLRTILTTASPLLPESFDYVYKKIKKDVCLSSISGGSDIVSCFALGNPILPVYRGELQCLGLGMNVKIFNGNGNSIINEKGELVCTSPFPAMPIYFWNDPDRKKYHAAYFERYPGVWTQGDFGLLNERGGLIIFGRSDATLNPGGIRIGTAEIYQQVEKMEDIIDSLAVGQVWKGSERIILFVVMRKAKELTPTLCNEIKSLIRKNTSPHHVPEKIIAVPELPRTISGKIVEIAVKKKIHHETVKNIEALANPESLKYFENLEELKT